MHKLYLLLTNEERLQFVQNQIILRGVLHKKKPLDLLK